MESEQQNPLRNCVIFLVLGKDCNFKAWGEKEGNEWGMWNKQSNNKLNSNRINNQK